MSKQQISMYETYHVTTLICRRQLRIFFVVLVTAAGAAAAVVVVKFKSHKIIINKFNSFFFLFREILHLFYKYFQI